MEINKILVLGASGMLGNAVYLYLSNESSYQVYGSVRSADSISLFPRRLRQKLVINNVTDMSKTEDLFITIRPQIVINCIGVVKQLGDANNPLVAIPINALLPHQLYQICEKYGSRLIHVSTDCVFKGDKGMYKEDDIPDAHDLYGLSKFLGEVVNPNSITLRTSIIGHELLGRTSLLCWFLAQSGAVKGFRNAIFSGMPTTEVARIICDYIIPNSMLYGRYNLSVEPIDKFNLLKLFKDVYNKQIDIELDESVKINRSLDSSKFRSMTGYQPPDMRTLVTQMRDLYFKWNHDV